MTLNEYQQQAMTTCMPASENFSYMMLNLVGEVGEVASKVAKAIRKNKATIGLNKLLWSDNNPEETDRHLIELRKECGDVLWQLAGLCTVMGFSLDDVAQENLRKLADRQQRHVIDGNGDER